jgi:hypothetical protein
MKLLRLIGASVIVSTSAWCAPLPCGLSPNDWCPAPAGDACGIHETEVECRADSKCTGMPYRSESMVACQKDTRGFSTNCPVVGCLSRGDRSGQ